MKLCRFDHATILQSHLQFSFQLFLFFSKGDSFSMMRRLLSWHLAALYYNGVMRFQVWSTGGGE
jgi:hypothetical protein